MFQLLCFYLAKMGTTENTKLCDFTSTNNNDFICTPIAPTAPEASFFEIKPALLNLVMKEQFSGVGTDDAAAHLNNFVELCEIHDVPHEIIKLKYGNSTSALRDASILAKYTINQRSFCSN